MKSTSKLVAAAGLLGAMGVAVLPLASFAANPTTGTTTVQVVIGDECNIGDGLNGAGTGSGAVTLSLGLDLASKPFGNTASDGTITDDTISVTCNTDEWELTQKMSTSTTGYLVGVTTTDNGFGPVSGGFGSPAAFTGGINGNAWGMKYTGTDNGNNVIESAAKAWHAVPVSSASPMLIASGDNVVDFQIGQDFGARYVSPLSSDTYKAVVLYTLTGVNLP